MKTFLSIFVFLFLLNSCGTDDSGSSNGASHGCGTYNGHVLQTGEQGGCYYINSGGNKTYIDRSYCNC